MAEALKSITWDAVESSNISALFFHEPSQTICVKFNNGGLYTYMGADHEIYTNLRMANSIGQYLHRVVKSLPYTRWDDERQLLDHLNI